MTKNRFIGSLLATTICTGVAFAAPASAQNTTDPSAQAPTGPVEAAAPDATVNSQGQPTDQSEQAIVITGSRIPQPNLTSVAPVTVVSQQDLQLQGTTRVEDLLNTLPQVSAGQSAGLANGATGIATVDLRGLGSVRTLVLVNGRRLLPGDPTDSSADLNAIPDSLIKRVEVLTGGASSTYGADAVAGVVNFIMDTDFTGVRIDGEYSFYQHQNRNKITPPILDARAASFSGYNYPTGSVADGGQINTTITMGAGFDDNRGHVVGYFGYRKVNAVTQNRRDYSACTIQTNATGIQCGGSATSGTGNAFVYDNGTSTAYQFAGDQFQPGLSRFNFAPTNYFQRPDERYTAGVFANYELSSAIKPYMEFMFMDDRTLAQIAPSGDFGNTLTINCDNPLIGTNGAGNVLGSARDVLCDTENLVNGFLGNYPLTPVSNPGVDPISYIDPTTGASYNKAFFQLLRRNVEGGPRIADLRHTEYRGVVGARGDIDPNWSYDAYYQYGRTNYTQIYRGEFSIARLNRALDVVTGPGGTPVCRSVLTGDDPACVPYDVFSGNPIAPEAIDYLSANGFQSGIVTEQIAEANITGQLGAYGIQTPWATDGVGINVGAQYRKESLDLQTDQAFTTGDLTGQGAPTKPVQGSFNVKEVYGELQIPIVQDNFIDSFSLNAGYRYSYYSISNGRHFSTDTWKIGAELAPISDIKFRGSVNRAVRAPNIQELFAPNIVALDGSTDPCAGFTITAADTGCIAQGLSVGQKVAANPAGQYNGFIGGTSTLRPERALTKTAGVVLQPSFLQRFALTVDWYDIKVKDAIQGFGADTIIATCTNTADPSVCALVHRNPVSGSLWLTPDGYVIDLSENVGSVHTRGIDVSASYSHQIGGLGSLGLSFTGTWLDKFVVDPGLPQTAAYDCAGFYGSKCSLGQGASSVPSAPNAKWRHKARATFNMENGVGLSVQWRYFGSVDQDFTSSNPTLAGDFDPFGAHLKAQSYFDLVGTFAIGDHYNFRLGVNNIFDKQPPLVSSGRSDGTRNPCPTGPCNGNTYPAVYDALGRYIFAGVTLDF